MPRGGGRNVGEEDRAERLKCDDQGVAFADGELPQPMNQVFACCRTRGVEDALSFRGGSQCAAAAIGGVGLSLEKAAGNQFLHQLGDRRQSEPDMVRQVRERGSPPAIEEGERAKLHHRQFDRAAAAHLGADSAHDRGDQLEDLPGAGGVDRRIAFISK